MKRNLPSESGIFTGRALLACLFCSVGVSLAMLSFATMPSTGSSANSVATTIPGFHAPVTMPVPGGSEPSLAITGDTNRSVLAGLRYNSWQSPGKFALSADGVNFLARGTPSTGAAGDVTTQVSYSGTVYNGQICGLPTELHTCIWQSLDGAVTWTERNMLADNHPGASDRPWIDVYPKRNTTATATDPSKDIVYLEFHTFSPEDLVYVTKSTDGGANFGPPIPVEQGTNALDSTCNTIPGGIIVDQNSPNGNTVYALWLAGDDVVLNEATGCNYSQIGPFPKAYVSKSTDGGTTWTPVLAWQGAFDLMTNIGDNAGKIFSTITQDTSGQIHIGLSVRHNDDPRTYFTACQTDPNCLETKQQTDMYIVTSPDQGAHWTLPFKVNQTTGSFFFPWIHAGSAGRLDVANYSSTSLRPNDPTSIWFVGMSQVTGAVAQYTGGPNATYVTTPVATPQILLDPNRVHGNGTTGGGICTYGLSCMFVPGSNRNLADVFEVHLDPAGGANVTWTSDNGGNHIGFACQNSGASAIAGAPDLNGCYGPTDMSIAMTGSNSVPPGGSLTYHITVTNNGAPTMPATTSGVTVSDVLPAGVTFVSATPSTGSCSGTSAVTCSLGIFPSGATATIDIVVQTPKTCFSLSNTATVAAATNDPTPANNTVSVMTSVSPLAAPTAVSRKMHGAGTFDINLPLTGTPGIECRTGPASGVHQVVIAFPAPSITVTSATVTPGPGGTASIILAPGHQPPNEVVATLSNVSNAQTLTINLLGVSDGCTRADVHIPMGVLLGDVDANRVVDGNDVSGVQGHTRQSAGSTNFRYDVDTNGVIDGNDVSTTQGHTRTGLP